MKSKIGGHKCALKFLTSNENKIFSQRSKSADIFICHFICPCMARDELSILIGQKNFYCSNESHKPHKKKVRQFPIHDRGCFLTSLYCIIHPSGEKCESS